MSPYREKLDNTVDGPHVALQDRAYSMPTPPPIRMVIQHDSPGWPFLPLVSGPSYDPRPTGLPSVDFIRSIDYGDHVTGKFISDWNYESRRTAQRILPFLYVGPTSVTRDLTFLREHRITLILAFRNSAAAHIRGPAPKAAKALGIALEEIMTMGHSEIVKELLRAIKLINTHMTERFQVFTCNGRQSEVVDTNAIPAHVLVTDETGNEEAAVSVAAYIMAVHYKDWDYAAKFVQAQRFCATFGNGELEVLMTFNQLLQAQRDVMRALEEVHEAEDPQQGQNLSIAIRPRKRGLERGGDEDMDTCNMGDEMDLARFMDREILEPFRDAQPET